MDGSARMFCSSCCSLSPLRDVESQHTAARPRQGAERSSRHFGEQLYGNLDFHTWETKPGAWPGFVIGLGAPWDVKPVCSHSTLPETRGVRETSARNSVTQRGGRTHHQPRPGDSSSESPSQQEFRLLERCGSHLAAAAWVGDVEPALRLGNVPAALLPAEGCFPGLCLSLKTKPGDAHLTACPRNSLLPLCSSSSQSTASFGLFTAVWAEQGTKGQFGDVIPSALPPSPSWSHL